MVAQTSKPVRVGAPRRRKGQKKKIGRGEERKSSSGLCQPFLTLPQPDTSLAPARNHRGINQKKRPAKKTKEKEEKKDPPPQDCHPIAKARKGCSSIPMSATVNRSK